MGYHPHVWLDPKINQTFAKEIKDEFMKKDLKHKDDYREKLQKIKRRSLRKLITI